MEEIYYFETIKECEEFIKDKSITLDLIHTSNTKLFECFICTIRTIMVWGIIISTIVAFNTRGFKASINIFCILMGIYLVGCLLMSWVKFNHNHSYVAMKHALVNNLINSCKEFQETDCEDWQRKQIVKRFRLLANIYDNDK